MVPGSPPLLFSASLDDCLRLWEVRLVLLGFSDLCRLSFSFSYDLIGWLVICALQPRTGRCLALLRGPSELVAAKARASAYSV